MWELVVDSVVVVLAVVAVVVVGSASPAPCVNWLSALLPRPEAPDPDAAADAAHAGATPAALSAPTASRQARHSLACTASPVRIPLDTGRAYRLRRGPASAAVRAAGPRASQVAHNIEWRRMPPKQRQIRMEQRGSLQAIQALEKRSDEELEAETKYKAAAMAILGARASERFDADAARAYFQRAIAAARPQERMQIRRMADASLALAERRAGDLKDAVERLGQAPPSGRQLFALRAMGLLIPPASAGIIARMRGILLIILLIIVLLAIGTGIVELISLPFGGLGIAPSILLGLFVVFAALGITAAIGRRRRDRARAAAG